LPIDFAFFGDGCALDIFPSALAKTFLSWLDGIEAGWLFHFC